MNIGNYNERVKNFLETDGDDWKEFQEKSKGCVFHVRIRDSCGVDLVNEKVLSSSLTEDQLFAFFAVTKRCDPHGFVRYGQLFERRITFWFCNAEESSEHMASYGQYEEDFVLFTKDTIGSLYKHIITVVPESVKVIDIFSDIELPTRNPTSIIPSKLSTSNQLLSYLKQLSSDELYKYVQTIKIN